WKGKNIWTWNMSQSRYKVSEKFEYGPGNLKRYEFNFKGREPTAAMREELIDIIAQNPTQAGFQAVWLQLPEHQFLLVQGQQRPVPASHLMLVRVPPEVK